MVCSGIDKGLVDCGGFRLWLCIDLNLLLGSLEVRVVCGAFCLGGGSWVRGLCY